MDDYSSPLHRMSKSTPTDYWNDSCAEEELKYALKHGAVGATSNPVIVLAALKKEFSVWGPIIHKAVSAHRTESEDHIAWRVIARVASTRAQHFEPVYRHEKGKKGRLSIQTNPKYFANPHKLVEQAVHFNTCYPNNNVKIPATRAGIEAIEEATALGISINATVSFSVSQAIAVAEAVERGLHRRTQEGGDISAMAPVCTIMVGRADDWMKQVVKSEKLIVNPEWLEWAGVAIMKRAYTVYQSKHYRTRLLAASFRNHYHWSQFIGADMVISIPYVWARRLNNSNITVEPRIAQAVNPDYIAGLRDAIPDFVRAYEPDGMRVDEFDSYGATRITLRQFLSGYSEFVTLIREYVVSDPDK